MDIVVNGQPKRIFTRWYCNCNLESCPKCNRRREFLGSQARQLIEEKRKLYIHKLALARSNNRAYRALSKLRKGQKRYLENKLREPDNSTLVEYVSGLNNKELDF